MVLNNVINNWLTIKLISAYTQESDEIDEEINKT